MLRRIGLALLLGVVFASPASGREWARKMFNTFDHDFGSVARGAKAEFAFPIRNIYIEDVHIASVRASCSCTNVRIQKPDLKTYETGAIVATINTQAFQGRKGATITVTIDKPFYAEVQLHSKVYIRSDVVLNPGSVKFDSVDQGKAAEKEVTINYVGRSDWKILGVKSANPHLTAEAVEKSRGAGRVVYQLKTHLDEEMPAGYLHDHLVLETNDYNRRQVPVLVEGRVLAGVTVSPSVLFMGVVEPGKTVTKQLVVRSKRPFRILGIECDDESFEFDTEGADEPKALHLIPVTFLAGEDLGKVTKKIRIETDLKDMTPELAAYAMVNGE